MGLDDAKVLGGGGSVGSDSWSYQLIIPNTRQCLTHGSHGERRGLREGRLLENGALPLLRSKTAKEISKIVAEIR